MADPVDNKPKVVVGGAEKRSFRSYLMSFFKNPVKLIVVVVVVALVIGGGIFAYQQLTAKKQTVLNDEQKSALLNKANPMLTPAKAFELKSTVDEIKNVKDYEKDPNYLYILTYYYAFIGNGNEAANYYHKLVAVYKPDAGYSQTLAKTVISMDRLKSQINFINARGDETKKNSFTVQDPNL